MLALHPAPRPRLAAAVLTASPTRARSSRTSSRRGRIGRRAAIFVLILGGLSVAFGGTAHAISWPWDAASNFKATIVNFCGPENVPTPSSYKGVDQLAGLNGPTAANAALRKTYIPSGYNPASTNAGQNLQAAFNGPAAAPVVHPTYGRYGFDSLTWTNYGSGCFSNSYWFNSVSNLLLELTVKLPSMITMGILNFALNNVIYTAFAAIISPFIKVFAAIFQPWVAIFAVGIGVPLVWIKSKGSATKVLGAAGWIVLVMTLFFWLNDNTSRVVTTANNFVTSFSSSAACQINQASSGNQGGCAQDQGLGAVDQALWYAVPYQTWADGEVGTTQAQVDRAAEQTGQIGWSGAILNGLYVGTDANGNVDAQGQQVLHATGVWNNATYDQTGNTSKSHYWTTKDATLNHQAIWQAQPFLTAVKFMCGDHSVANGGTGDPDPANNGWYPSYCNQDVPNPPSAISQMIPNFQGQDYNNRITAAWVGWVASGATLLTCGAVAVYLALQKMAFYLILLFAPLFLAIGAFPDEKRRQFAVRYVEMFVANVMKQVVAVCVVLFVSYSMGQLLTNTSIPLAVKPLAAICFFIALVVFALPLKRILSAAAKGDKEVIDRTFQMPGKIAKTTAKLGVTAAAAAATGGASLGAAAGAAGAGAGAGAGVGAKAAGAAAKLGGSKGGVQGLLKGARHMGITNNPLGKAIYNGVQLGAWKNDLKTNKAANEGRLQAKDQGIDLLARSNPGRYERANDGTLTPRGRERAGADYDSVVGGGGDATSQARDAALNTFFANFKTRTGESHPYDPKRAGGAEGSFDELASRLLNAPSWARDKAIHADTSLTSSAALARAGYANVEDASRAVPELVQSYDLGQMDPRHPATPALLAVAHAEADTPAEQHAIEQAVQAVLANGVPGEVSKVWSAGKTPIEFPVEAVVAAVPTLSAETTGDVRLEHAVKFNAIASLVPNDSEVVADAVNRFREALADASQPWDAVNNLGEVMVQTFRDVDPTLTTRVPRPAAWGSAATVPAGEPAPGSTNGNTNGSTST